MNETAGTPITEDFVEHSHPQYGMGYFCTEDVLAKVAALTTQRDEAGQAYKTAIREQADQLQGWKDRAETAEAQRERLDEMDALLMGSLPLGMCTEGPDHALRNLIDRAGALQAELDAAKRALAEAISLLMEAREWIKDNMDRPNTNDIAGRIDLFLSK